MFCVKLILWSIVAQKGTNILIFIFSNMVLNMVLNVVLNLVLHSISSFFTEHLWATASVIISPKKSDCGFR